MSTLKADTIQNTSGGAVTLTKADTIKFRVMQSGDSPTIDASLNLSSLDDIAAGKYRYNFTTNFSNGFYTPTALSTEDGTAGYLTIYYSRDYATRVSNDLELNGINHNNQYDDGRWTSVHSSGDLA